MEKPQSKEEIMFEWFLGDAKEILGELKTTLTAASAVKDALTQSTAELSDIVESSKSELILANRELLTVIRNIEGKHKATLVAMDARAGELVAATQRRTIVYAVAGGIVGAVAAALLLHFLGT